MPKTNRPDIYQEVTDSIVKMLNDGAKAGDYQRPWSCSSALTLPSNWTTQNHYNGINIFVLWTMAEKLGFTLNEWATYKQWSEIGGQVRKGEKASPVAFVGAYRQADEDGNTDDDSDENIRRYLKRYRVFNIAQVDGIEPPNIERPSLAKRLENAETFIANTTATIRHGYPIGKLDTFSRAQIAALDTPIEAMPRLAEALGGPQLFVKRDDLTGLGLGGNKARQVEFWLGDAQSKGADTILITGAVQSNYVRTAAAGAAKLGMDCHVQLEERVKDTDEAYRVSGNVLLDKLLGATLYSYPEGEDEVGADRNLGVIADGLRAKGRTPYIIPLGPGHDPIGALDYVDCAREIIGQIQNQTTDLPALPDAVVIASGSSHTHAGFLVGLRALGVTCPVVGVCVRRTADQQAPRVKARTDEISNLLGLEPLSDSDIEVYDGALGPGYGKPGDDTIEAMTLAARCEGVIVDPVYTGKVMAGLIAQVRSGRWTADQRVLFIHKGGAPSLFAYEPTITARLDALNA